jgi:hypothetical protein
MALSITGNLTIAFYTEKGSGNLHKMIPMKDNINTIRSMAMEYINGTMERYFKDSLQMMKRSLRIQNRFPP